MDAVLNLPIFQRRILYLQFTTILSRFFYGQFVPAERQILYITIICLGRWIVGNPLQPRVMYGTLDAPCKTNAYDWNKSLMITVTLGYYL